MRPRSDRSRKMQRFPSRRSIGRSVEKPHCSSRSTTSRSLATTTPSRWPNGARRSPYSTPRARPNRPVPMPSWRSSSRAGSTRCCGSSSVLATPTRHWPSSRERPSGNGTSAARSTFTDGHRMGGSATTSPSTRRSIPSGHSTHLNPAGSSSITAGARSATPSGSPGSSVMRSSPTTGTAEQPQSRPSHRRLKVVAVGGPSVSASVPSWGFVRSLPPAFIPRRGMGIAGCRNSGGRDPQRVGADRPGCHRRPGPNLLTAHIAPMKSWTASDVRRAWK